MCSFFSNQLFYFIKLFDNGAGKVSTINTNQNVLVSGDIYFVIFIRPNRGNIESYDNIIIENTNNLLNICNKNIF